MPDLYDIDSYDFDLPGGLIAQRPADRRDSSRLLRVDCAAGGLRDMEFAGIIDLLRPGDLLVVNNTKVFPARLLGRKDSGGKAELLLLGYPRGTGGEAVVEGLVKSSRRPRPGSRIVFGPDLDAEVTALGGGGAVRAVLRWRGDLDDVLGRHGRTPLPPYIRQGDEERDRRRYQTVYARHSGAVAAPTAGLHFTGDLLAAIAELGVEIAEVTLHVGYATFAPVRVRDIRDHRIHGEFVRVGRECAGKVAAARKAGGRIWAVGTTAARSLEFAADGGGGVRPVAAECRLYIYPGYTYKVVDNLITNFHLPKSSLLFMVSAFAGYETIMRAYRHAVEHGYRFFSYGDAMALVRQ